MSSTIYILQDVDIELTMPDGSVQSFTLQRPNGQDPHWYRIRKDVPSGKAIYKDPTRRKQRSQTFYYPEFHFIYDHHRMFITKLLTAEKIELITGWKDWRIECLLMNDDAVKNYLEGLSAATDAPGAGSNPVPSGALELVLGGKKRENWQQALSYFFYYLPGHMVVTFDSTQITWDSTEVRFV